MTHDVRLRHGMTASDILALPATVDLITAGRAFGIGRTTAYALARSDNFPCRVIRAGKAYRAVTADLLRVLHITPEISDAPAGATAEASSEHVTHAA